MRKTASVERGSDGGSAAACADPGAGALGVAGTLADAVAGADPDPDAAAGAGPDPVPDADPDRDADTDREATLFSSPDRSRSQIAA
jgi:hypothetical protein